MENIEQKAKRGLNNTQVYTICSTAIFITIMISMVYLISAPVTYSIGGACELGALNMDFEGDYIIPENNESRYQDLYFREDVPIEERFRPLSIGFSGVEDLGCDLQVSGSGPMWMLVTAMRGIEE